ncbi:MAG: heat-inducible transcription repressor HrcA [Clostridia bacterium]|nr:heat-inducible transcription repressor HrcA [Clostridia bacterium]
MTQLLDVRKMNILRAIVDDYILTAAPVGSRTLSKRDDIELSPATIRNEMSDLTELGFLEQPHTSAGRIPSEKAYRLYVSNIMDRAKLTDDEAEYIKAHLQRRVSEVGDVIKETARMLSGITKYTSIVQMPHLKNARLKHISLIPVTTGSALAVVVTNSGATNSTMLNVPSGITSDHLEKITSLMNERLAGYKLVDVQKTLLPMLREEVGEQADSVAAMLGSLSDDIDRQDYEVVGAANMLDYPEYSDVSKARSFLTELERGEIFKEVLSDGSGVELTVRIGTENDNPELKDCSVITICYRVGGEQVGSMAVIGPTRMDYEKVVAVLKCMSESLSSVLSGMLLSSPDGGRNE